MSPHIKISDLLNPDKLNLYKEDLMGYFEKGGTWKELLGFTSSNLKANYEKAIQFYHKKKFGKAASLFSLLTTLDPYQFIFWMGLGKTRQAHLEFAEAIVAYTVASGIDPEHPEPHFLLAQAYNSLQQKEMILKHLRNAISLAEGQTEHQELKAKAEIILTHLEQ